MLRKLFAYDFKAIGKPMGLFSLIAILSSIVGAAAQRAVPALYTVENKPVLSNILSGSATMVIIACWLAVVAFTVLTVIFVLRRYYTNFFTDEGYLTFTLPVKPGTHLVSKFLAGYLWTLIGMIVTVLCVAILILVGTADKGLVNTRLVNDIVYLFKMIFRSTDKYMLRWFIEFVLTVLIGAAYSLLLMYLSVTLGSIVAKKHKILAAIGLYYAISLGISLLMNLISVFTTTSITTSIYSLGDIEQEIYGLVDSMFLGYVALFAAAAIAAFFINRRLLKKKLNLN